MGINMKLRYGFVSNSSSCSFVCCICGEIESGMDACLSDFEMSSCINGHEFHHECAKIDDPESAYDTFEAKKKYVISCIENAKITSWYTKTDKETELEEVKVYTEENNEEELNDSFNDYFADHGISKELCPICNMKCFTDSDLMEYLIVNSGKTRKQIEKEIKKEFANYDLFMVYLKREEK